MPRGRRGSLWRRRPRRYLRWGRAAALRSRHAPRDRLRGLRRGVRGRASRGGPMRLTGHRAGVRTGLLAMALFGGGCGKSDGPPPDIVDTDALRAIVSACLGSDAATSAWFFWDARFGGVGPADATRRCVEAAADCGAVLGCAGLSDEPCDGDEHCDGTVAVTCLDISAGFGRKQYLDCAGDMSGNTT